MEPIQADVNKKKKTFFVLKQLGDILWFKNPLRISTTNEVLIFDHDRKKKVNGEFIDIYSYDLIDRLKSNKISFKVLERPFKGEHLTPDNSNRYFQDFLVLISILIKPFVLWNKAITKKDKDMIIQVNTELGVNLLSKQLIRSYALEFWSKYYCYKYLLNRLKPSRIYVVVHYAYTPLIVAANELEIDVTEIQHGTIDRFHLSYNYPSDLDKHYVPKFFECWGSYWINTPLPYSEDDIEITGFSYLERSLSAYTFEKTPKSLVVISQGAIGRNLLEFIKRNQYLFEHYLVIYKLHPSEYFNISFYNEVLEFCESKSNFRVATNEEDLYAVLASCEFTLGVYSTAMYEAIAFNCIPCFVDIPGIDSMKELIDRYSFEVLSDNTKTFDLNYKKLDLDQLKRDLFGIG